MPANSDFFDAQLRHQVGLQRLSAGEVKRVQVVLKQSDKELTALLKARLTPGDFTSQRYKRMLADVKAMRRETMRQIGKASASDLKALARSEQVFMKDMLEKSVPVRLDFATADASRLASAVIQNPFTAGTNGAKTLNQWWSGLAAADADRIVGAVQLGMVQGETIGQMVKRVVNATDMTRRNAEAVIRTGVNHVSNSARGEFFKANKDVMGALMWSAMLDGRTTIICASRDGHHAPVDGVSWDNVPTPHLDSPNDRPPAHVQCRSFMVGVLNGDGVAQKMPNRAFVRDTRTRRMREKDFRIDAKNTLGPKNWKAMTAKERNAAIAGERRAWAKANIGQAPGKINYEQWLKKQPTKFQDQVLGKAKAAEFRKGAKLSKFVDKRGNELTLDQLKKGGGDGGIPSPVSSQVKWVSGLDETERAAFMSWTGASYADLRAIDSGISTGSAVLRRDLSAIYAALGRAPVYQSTIYRGLAVSNKELAVLLSSKDLELNALSSASSNLDVAVGYARTRVAIANTVKQHVVLRFDTHSGVSLSGLTKGDAEVLLQGKHSFSIRQSIWHASSGDIPEWWEVVLEENK